ncbi:DUF2264 domain-containing protein [Pseudarthrobacter sp. J75]|uniref:DUF2264 domain-containing protein n=1 Tax=unclassified Pseudarthrobacter TaxID=2647000 RepID=UPI002E802413|nr:MULTISPECIES: DUF2264 domain-containing protein [unclassified Pseudarthrobacter]MEE2524205.1 DUF2264 domain-containing protein [Pseudarthrobacter sp. J47]MEE2530243.1 DUF2264 domain-containing protein [Pseudarthrobacter sp. J75]
MTFTVSPPALTLPPRDYELSPYTGLTRDHWCAYADHLLRSAHRYATDDHANLHLPGANSAYGPRSDSLEAFARTFLLASFRMAGDPQGTGWIADWYAAGLDAGTDPANPDRWPTPGELGQAKVEAASLAVGLALTRKVLWDRLPGCVQEQLIAWFETVIGEEYPPINWVWFQIVVETFLASVGGRFSDEDIDAGLAIHDSLYRSHGWFADGPERSYDHYVGWAFQVYPQLLQLMAPEDPRVQARSRKDGERLADFLDDAVYLVGANGAPLIQGRSLIYRFAAAAPFWSGQLLGNTRLSPGLTRRAASGILDYFLQRGAINGDGLLSIGFHGEFPAMKQSYSGTGSPYWAAKGMMGLALPADHPVWTAVEAPLPVEVADTRRFISAPGWQVDGTVSDGVVRVRNHGTDHATVGARITDSPLYARLGYSTATFPDLEPESVDNAVVMVDGEGRLTHRTGFEFLGQVELDGVQVGASRASTNWITVDPDGGPDHGSGAKGTAAPGPEITVISLTRGAVELRLVRVRGADGQARLRIGGWPVDAASELISEVRALPWGEKLDDAGTWERQQAHPVGEHLTIPWIGTSGAAVDGDYAAVVGLGGEGVRAELDGARFLETGQFQFSDGTAVDVAAVIPRLVRES